MTVRPEGPSTRPVPRGPTPRRRGQTVPRWPSRTQEGHRSWMRSLNSPKHSWGGAAARRRQGVNLWDAWASRQRGGCRQRGGPARRRRGGAVASEACAGGARGAGVDVGGAHRPQSQAQPMTAVDRVSLTPLEAFPLGPVTASMAPATRGEGGAGVPRPAGGDGRLAGGIGLSACVPSPLRTPPLHCLRPSAERPLPFSLLMFGGRAFPLLLPFHCHSVSCAQCPTSCPVGQCRHRACQRRVKPRSPANPCPGDWARGVARLGPRRGAEVNGGDVLVCRSVCRSVPADAV